MILRDSDPNFHPDLEVVCCFCEYNGKFVLLHRQDNKPSGNKWCLPGGKIKDPESPVHAVRREVWEETGLAIVNLKLVHVLRVQYPEFQFAYHVFQGKAAWTKVVIRPEEHKDFRWITPEVALTFPLIEDEDANIKMIYGL